MTARLLGTGSRTGIREPRTVENTDIAKEVRGCNVPRREPAGSPTGIREPRTVENTRQAKGVRGCNVPRREPAGSPTGIREPRTVENTRQAKGVRGCNVPRREPYYGNPKRVTVRYPWLGVCADSWEGSEDEGPGFLADDWF